MKTDSSEQAVRCVPLADMSAIHARFAILADGLVRDHAACPSPTSAALLRLAVYIWPNSPRRSFAI